MRDSFVLYTSIKEITERLSDEQKGKLFQAILDYQTDLKPILDDPMVEIAFIPIRQGLDANNEKWEATREARSKAGKKSAESRQQKSTKTTSVDFVGAKNNKAEQSPTNPTVYVNEYVNENVNDIKEKRTRFTPPSVDEVKNYCRERQNSIDADSFVDFYTSKGWKVGGQPMKDWKAAVRTWERRDKGEDKLQKGHFENERSYNFAEIERTLVGGAI